MRGVFSLNERDRSSDPGYISGASNYLNRSADLYTSRFRSCNNTTSESGPKYGPSPLLVSLFLGPGTTR
jgi:hypothetical protein